jgi:hypothetical protein
MSHWDFGRGPAGQHDEAVTAESAFRYGPGEVTYRRAEDQRPGGEPGADALEDEADSREDQAGGREVEDEEPWPYPVTYERDRIEPGPAAFRPGGGADDPDDPYEIWPPAPVPDSLYPDGLSGGGLYGDLYGDDLAGDDHYAEGLYADGQRPGSELEDGPRAWPPPPRSATRPPRAWSPRSWSPRSWSPRTGAGRRGRIAAGAAVAAAAVIGASTLLLSGGHPGTAAAPRAAASPPAPTLTLPSPQAARPPSAAAAPPSTAGGPPLTLAQAQAVLAAYTAGSNRANAARSASELAAIETGSSYAIDTGRYRAARASGAAPYPAFAPAAAAYYRPRAEPGPGPRWFAVRVANAFASSPDTVSSVEYLLFLQAVPGGPWRNAIEPYLLPGAAAPAVPAGGDGLATAVSPAAAALAVAPVRLPAVTAGALDGSGALAVPAAVADQSDVRAWRRTAPRLTITDRHAPATAGQAFALRTAGGGALVFYTVAATVTITPPPGSVFHLAIPGLQAPGPPLRRVVLQYRDQFAAYDPPAGSGPPVIIAAYSGITREL